MQSGIVYARHRTIRAGADAVRGQRTLEFTVDCRRVRMPPHLSKPVTLADRTPGDAAAVTTRGSNDACPRCSGPSSAPSLLTSMTRYYLCGSCGERWQVERNWQRLSD